MRCFSPTALALGSSVSVPQTVRYTHLPVSCSFWGKWLLPQGRFCGRLPHYSLHLSRKWLLLPKRFLVDQLFFTFVSQSPSGVKLHDMSHPYTSSPRKAIHHGFGIGVVFGLILCLRKGIPVSCYHNQRTASDGRCDSSTGSLQTEH